MLYDIFYYLLITVFGDWHREHTKLYDTEMFNAALMVTVKIILLKTS